MKNYTEMDIRNMLWKVIPEFEHDEMTTNIYMENIMEQVEQAKDNPERAMSTLGGVQPYYMFGGGSNVVFWIDSLVRRANMHQEDLEVICKVVVRHEFRHAMQYSWMNEKYGIKGMKAMHAYEKNFPYGEGPMEHDAHNLSQSHSPSKEDFLENYENEEFKNFMEQF